MQTGRDDLRTRIFATEFLSNWYRANGLYRNAEALLTHTIDSLPPESAQLGATLRCERAELWGQLGRLDEALTTLTHEIAVDDPDDSVASRCLLARARFALNSGDADGALEYSQAARQRFELAGVDTVYGRAEILTALGGRAWSARRIRGGARPLSRSARASWRRRDASAAAPPRMCTTTGPRCG